MVPGRMPSRPVLGLGLVALGAILVLLRRRGDDA
jgi:MYXO-CTERM domain-containing protein